MKTTCAYSFALASSVFISYCLQEIEKLNRECLDLEAQNEGLKQEVKIFLKSLHFLNCFTETLFSGARSLGGIQVVTRKGGYQGG